MPAPPLVLYDGDCAFCTATAKLGRRHVTSGTDVEWRPWQEVDLPEPLRERAHHEVLLVHPDRKRVWGGVDMVAALLLNSPRPYWWPVGFLLRLPGVRGLGAVVYRWVSRHRGRIPVPRVCCHPPRA